MREIREARRQIARILELRDAAAGKLHGFRDVEQHRKVGVGVGLVLLDVVAIRARVHAPVDLADIVARHVAPMLGEIDRRAEIRRAMEAVDEAVHHGARQQVEAPDPRQDFRIDEPRTGNRSASRFHSVYLLAWTLITKARSAHEEHEALFYKIFFVIFVVLRAFVIPIIYLLLAGPHPRSPARTSLSL